MSQPFKDSGEGNAIQSASCEIIRAMSSMNMYPDPIQSAEDEPGYISQRDGNVKHAMEHLHAAFEYLIRAAKEKEALQAEVFQSSLKLLGATQQKARA